MVMHLKRKGKEGNADADGVRRRALL